MDTCLTRNRSIMNSLRDRTTFRLDRVVSVEAVPLPKSQMSMFANGGVVQVSVRGIGAITVKGTATFSDPNVKRFRQEVANACPR
jgi:hypothetical protein